MPTYSLKACPVATLPVPAWECFFGRNDVTMLPLTFYVWIVRGNGCIGLIDCGVPLQKEDLARLDEANQKVDERCVYSDVLPLDQLLAQEGIAPEAIDFVLITQLITYHTGGLVERLFPRARVYISKAGLMELLLDNPGHPPRDFYLTVESWAFLRQLLVEGRIFIVDEPTEVEPGIIFETTGGHHPGSAGVRVTTDRGIVGILETAFLQANIDEELPIGVAESASLCREAIRRYKGLCNFVAADHEPSLSQLFEGESGILNHDK